MKKSLTVALALLVLVLAFAGCTTEAGTATPGNSQTPEITDTPVSYTHLRAHET